MRGLHVVRGAEAAETEAVPASRITRHDRRPNPRLETFEVSVKRAHSLLMGEDRDAPQRVDIVAMKAGDEKVEGLVERAGREYTDAGVVPAR